MPSVGTQGTRTIVLNCARSTIGVRNKTTLMMAKPTTVVKKAIHLARKRGSNNATIAPPNVT